MKRIDGTVQRVDEVDVLLAGNAKHVFYPYVLEASHEQLDCIQAFAMRVPPGKMAACDEKTMGLESSS